MSGGIHKWIVIAALLLLPLFSWLAIAAKTNSDDLNNWIDKSSPDYHRFAEFANRFGGNDEVIVTWDGCTTDDERLPLAVVYVQRECHAWINRVTTGEIAVKELVESASKFTPSSARRRLRGSLFGDDLTTTCMIVSINQFGRENLNRLLAKIENATCDQARVPANTLHLGGKAVSDHAVNSHTNRSLWWGIPGALLAALISFFCISDLRLTIGIVFVSTLAGVASLAFVPLCGIQINGLLVLMPVLVFVLTLSCSVHMARALQHFDYQSEAGTYSRSELHASVGKSLAQSRSPVILSMLTTAVGIGSLAVSPISAVKQFGLLTSAGLLFSLMLLLLLLPSIWHVWGTSRQLERNGSGTDQYRRVTGTLISLNGRPWISLMLLAGLSIPAAIGITKFETDLNTHSLFAPTTRFSQDHNWIEENLYPLGRIELIVTFPKSGELNRFQQLRHVRAIKTGLRGDSHYHSALSVANFVKIPRSESPFQRQLTEHMIATQIEHDYDKLHNEGMLHSDETNDRWRISVACRIDDRNDERLVADRMLQLSQATMTERAGAINVEVTGMGPLAASGQRRLFGDLTRGLVSALIVITVLLMISLRNIPLSILAMVPNLFPILIVFGYCGLLGKKLDIGAILTASAGLGIAVDDTVHFLHYLRLNSVNRRLTDSARPDKLETAIRRSANPIITSSLIVMSGLVLFSFSDFLPIKNFAICLISMMAFAAIADLILLPAMLRVLVRRSTARF